jgi:hypothetical protein
LTSRSKSTNAEALPRITAAGVALDVEPDRLLAGRGVAIAIGGGVGAVLEERG